MKQLKKNIISQHIKRKYPATQKEANCAARKAIKTRKCHRENLQNQKFKSEQFDNKNEQNNAQNHYKK